MPTLIEMRLKATWAVRPDTRQLHGLACALFEEEPAEHSGRDKPFAVCPLQPGQTQEEWQWRAAWLPDAGLPARAAADVLRIGHVTCYVTQSTQRRVTHAALAAGAPRTAATVRFTTPTYFSHNGADTVIPDPRLIVGSWRRRWNASLSGTGPLTINDDEWTATRQLLELAAFDLRTERRDTGHGRDRAGFTGTARLRLAGNACAAARKIFGTLARFAEYCGTGAQTTHGFGATAMTGADG